MHAEAMTWVRKYTPSGPVAVVDVGGRDVNGTVRHLFDATSYVSVDLFPGPAVDIVGDFCCVDLDPVDVVICCEVAEHAENWRQIVAHAAESLAPGGLFLFTAAGPSRSPHSATDGGELRPGEWYRNITRPDLTAALDANFDLFEIDELGPDIRAVAWR